MTQQCKYDDQLLDYLYGELAEPERALFAQHLKSCSACAAQVESFGRVRSEYKNRPPIEPAGESMQRMTALLMQAATEQAAAAGQGETVSGGGGKILQFRSRGLRRILFHPAGGVMAVAAAALFWVVFRAQPGAHTGVSGPTTFRTAQEIAIEPAEPSAPAGAAKAPATPEAVAAAPADKSAPAAAPDSLAEAGGARPGPSGREGLLADRKSSRGIALDKDSGKDTDQGDDFAGLRAKPRPAKEPDSLHAAAPAEAKPKALAKPEALAQLAPGLSSASSAVAEKPSAGVTLDLRTPAAGTAAEGKGTARARGGEAQLGAKNAAGGVLDQQVFAKSAKKEAGAEAERAADRWAQPPPPVSAPAPVQAAPTAPPPAAAPAREPVRDEDDDSVSGAIARTRDQRQQKVVEALANQELGSLGPGGPAPAQSGDGRYAQHHAGVAKSDSAAGSGGRTLPADNEEAPAPAATPAARASSLSRGLASGGRDEGAAALAAIKEQLRRGQCAEAGAALTRLERSQPALHGLAETRAEWQTTCAALQVPQLAPQAAPPPERRLANDALESPASPAPPRAAKLRIASPSPAPAKAPARAKAAKPAERKAADALQ